MAVKIKLQRKGSKNKPFYRVVAQDVLGARDGKVIEILGSYEPLKEPSLFSVDPEKIKEWLKKGAQPTEKVRILLGKAGILPPVDLAVLPKRKPKAEERAEKPPAEVKGGEKKQEKAQEEKPLEEARGKEEQK